MMTTPLPPYVVDDECKARVQRTLTSAPLCVRLRVQVSATDLRVQPCLWQSWTAAVCAAQAAPQCAAVQQGPGNAQRRRAAVL